MTIVKDKIESIDISSDLYPVYLKEIKNPPSILYAKGNIDLLSQPAGVAIVGTRSATRNGLVITDRITRFVVGNGSIVVSGLALGIDTQAHRSCLAAGGQTIAVLAHGLHMVTPTQNTQLAQDILSNGGLWVSEHATGTPVERQHFVPRNRIQVGLSRCSVIVESTAKSGTTTHAKFCVQENHPLFAVVPQDGNPLKLNSEEPLMLVKTMGAMALQSKEDYKKLAEVLV